MNTLYIVGCGKSKLGHPAPARELYCGPYFTSSLGHALKYALDENILILSAKYGLVALDERLAPYELFLGDLSPEACADLAADIRSQIVRLFPLKQFAPLRIVCLAGAAYVSLFEAARRCTALEDVALRTPLRGKGRPDGRQWLGQGTYRTVCEVELPPCPELGARDNDTYHQAARAAALWWADQILRESPPGEHSLLADALALEICSAWAPKYARHPTAWPIDVRISITFQRSPGGTIERALAAIGLPAHKWWVREWGDRRFTAYMTFTGEMVTVRLGDTERVIFQA